MTNFWSHAATLFYAIALCLAPIAHADEIHEGLGAGADDINIPMDSNNDEEPRTRDGAVVGNIPAKKTPEDFLFKNRKDKEFPLEFLIPFMKVSQVFRKRVPAKADAPEQSAMAPAPKVRAAVSYTANLPPENKKAPNSVPATRSPAVVAEEIAGNDSSTDEAKELLAEGTRPGAAVPKPLVGARPAQKPSLHLIESLKVNR